MVVEVLVLVVAVVLVRISSSSYFSLRSFSPKSVKITLYRIALWIFLLSLLSFPSFASALPLNSVDMFEKRKFISFTGGGRGYGTQGHFNPAFIQGSGTNNSSVGGQ